MTEELKTKLLAFDIEIESDHRARLYRTITVIRYGHKVTVSISRSTSGSYAS